MTTHLKRLLLLACGRAYWFPDIERYFYRRGIRLIEDVMWCGFQGERRATIDGRPGCSIMFEPGAWGMRMYLFQRPVITQEMVAASESRTWPNPTIQIVCTGTKLATLVEAIENKL